jgi:hypothetical protein
MCFLDRTPSIASRVDILERCGCERCPIDISSEEGRVTLLSYVYADQNDRIDRTRAAIAVALKAPAQIDTADVSAWLPEKLRTRVPGTATVVFHSIVWQYLNQTTRSKLIETIEDAGKTATKRRPLAWLRMEPTGRRVCVRLKLWPGAVDRKIAEAGYHGPPVQWLQGG